MRLYFLSIVAALAGVSACADNSADTRGMEQEKSIGRMSAQIEKLSQAVDQMRKQQAEDSARISALQDALADTPEPPHKGNATAFPELQPYLPGAQASRITPQRPSTSLERTLERQRDAQNAQ